MSWWQFNFYDGAKPQGSRYLGSCIVQGDFEMHALERSWKLGCNPGGQAEGEFVEEPPEQFKNALLQRDGLEHLAKAAGCPF